MFYPWSLFLPAGSGCLGRAPERDGTAAPVRALLVGGRLWPLHLFWLSLPHYIAPSIRRRILAAHAWEERRRAGKPPLADRRERAGPTGSPAWALLFVGLDAAMLERCERSRYRVNLAWSSSACFLAVPAFSGALLLARRRPDGARLGRPCCGHRGNIALAPWLPDAGRIAAPPERAARAGERDQRRLRRPPREWSTTAA